MVGTLPSPARPDGGGAAPGRALTVRMFLLFLALSVFSGKNDALGLPFPPDRVALLIVILLVLASRRSGEPAAMQYLRPVHGAMLLMILWTIWSALGHETLFTSYGFYALFDRIVVPFAVYVLAPWVFRSEQDRAALLKWFVVLGLYLGLTAVFEVFGPTALIFPSYVRAGMADLIIPRAQGPFLSADANSLVLAACLFGSVLAVGRLSRSWRIAAVLCVPVTVLGVVLSLTRSVWIGIAVGALAAIIALPRLRGRLVALLLGGALAAWMAVLLIPTLGELVSVRLATQRSVFDRQNVNAAAFRVLDEHPLEGIGWGKFLPEAVDWVRQADTYPITTVDIEVHNVFLARAAELGLIGAGIFVICVLLGPVWSATGRHLPPPLLGWRGLLVGYGTTWFVGAMLSPLPYSLPNVLLWLLAGLCSSDRLISDLQSTSKAERSRLTT